MTVQDRANQILHQHFGHRWGEDAHCQALWNDVVQHLQECRQRAEADAAQHVACDEAADFWVAASNGAYEKAARRVEALADGIGESGYGAYLAEEIRKLKVRREPTDQTGRLGLHDQRRSLRCQS